MFKQKFHLTFFVILIFNFTVYSQTENTVLPKNSFTNEEEFWDKLRISIYKDANYNAVYDFQFFITSGLKKLQLNDYKNALKDFKRSLSILNATSQQKKDSTISKIPSPLIYIGITKSLLGESDSAIYYFKECIKSKLSIIEAYNELGVVYIKKGNLDSALFYYNKGLEVDKNNITTNYNIGYLNYLKGDYKSAKTFLKKTIKSNPQFELPYFLLGNISIYEHKLEKAEEYFSLPIKNNSNSILGYYYRGVLNVIKKRDDLAYSDFFKAYEQDTSNFNALIMIATIDIRANRMEIGIKRLIKCAQKASNPITQIHLDKPEDIELFEILSILDNGNLSEIEKKYCNQFITNIINNDRYSNKDHSVAFLQNAYNSSLAKRIYIYSCYNSNALKVDSLNSFIKKDSTLTYAMFLKGILNYEEKNYKECINLFTKLILLKPNYSPALYYRGLAFINTGEYQLAINDFNKIIEKKPNCVDAIFQRGNAYQNRNLDNEAIKDYLKSIDILPENTVLLNNISTSYRKLKLYDSTIYYSSKVIEIDSNNYYAYFNRGYAFKEMKKYENAILDLNKTLKKNPRWNFALTLRADILIETKSYKKAISDLSICIIDHPFDIEKYYEKRANSYFAISDYDNAISDFNKIIELNRSNYITQISIANCYKEKQDYQNAFKYYDLVLSKDSSISLVYYNKGLCYSSLNNSENAIKNFIKAVTIDSTYSLSYEALGFEYYKMNNFDKCIELSKVALQFDKNLLNALYNIALSELRKNNFSIAKRYYQIYSKLDYKDDNKYSQKAIDNLKDLVDKGILVSESKEILKDIFKITI